MPRKRNRKLSLEEAAAKLTEIAERHLSSLPEEEQDARVASFGRVEFAASRRTSASFFGKRAGKAKGDRLLKYLRNAPPVQPEEQDRIK
jgi:hypothetical protein